MIGSALALGPGATVAKAWVRMTLAAKKRDGHLGGGGVCVCVFCLKMFFCLCFCVLVLPGFSASSAGKESACKAGDSGSTTGSERSPGEGIGYPLQYSWASLVTQMVKNLPAMQET